MTVSQLALLPPSISGVSLSPSSDQNNSSDQSKSNRYGSTPATDMSFSPEALQLYAQYLGAPDAPNGAN